MDVTRNNFTKVLLELEKVLKDALFVSIDSEFTGLNAGEITHALDSPAEYYKKIRSGALDFLLVQFGLAAFTYDETTNKYSHRAYNFYIFPTPSIRNAPDTRFLCQASSLDFLAKNNFNFNKLFLEGIPYLSQSDEQSLREKLTARQRERKSWNFSPGDRNSIAVPNDHKETVAKACEQIRQFLLEKTKDELALGSCNGFVRKLIYQEAWKEFSRNDVALETSQNQIVVRRAGTTEEREKSERERVEKDEEALNEAVGFSHLIRMLSEADKLIVGHNMLLDLCHMLHRFCMPLPENYTDFKEMLHCLFPKILDTKYLCSCPEIKERVPSSILGHILATVADAPFQRVTIEPDGKNSGYCLEDNKPHEAGYDAFITGVIFITLSNYLGTCTKPQISPVLPTSPLLKRFINKLFLMKISDTHINLDGTDPEVNRDYVFHLTFPKEWTFQDINQLFKPYGNVYTTWLTDTTAFVSLSNREHTLSVTRNLVRSKKSKPDDVKVLTYHMYVQSTQAPVTEQSEVEHRGKKRKLSDGQFVDSPKKRFSMGRTSTSKRSIDSIPEEDESITCEEETDNIGCNKSIRNCDERRGRSLEAEVGERPRFFEENQDWN